MKKYSTPIAEILKLSSEDIMTLSGLRTGSEPGDEGAGIDFGGFGDTGLEV